MSTSSMRTATMARRAREINSLNLSAATVVRLPAPAILRAMDELVTIAGLALEAVAIGDRDLLVDCRRWHDERHRLVTRRAA